MLRISKDYDQMELNVAAGKFTGLKVRAHLSRGCNIGKLLNADDFVPLSYKTIGASLKKWQNMLYKSYWNGTCRIQKPKCILIQG